MKLIVGLGNPGEKYEKTRHNLGFIVIDKLLKEFSKAGEISWEKKTKFKSEIAEIEWHRQKPLNDIKNSLSEKIILAKPLTFMNLSGSAVSAIASFYKILPANVWVIHDDIDLNLGALKIRIGGSSAGHKGVESIIKSLGTDKFWRFRLGIGQTKLTPADKYVLKDFGRGEGGKLKNIIKKSVKALESGFEVGLDKTMNKFNAK